MEKKEYEEIAEEELNAVTGGTGKAAGWTCATCGAVVKIAKAKDGVAYCIPCYKKKFGDPTA